MRRNLYRALALARAVVRALSLAACGKSSDAPKPGETAQPGDDRLVYTADYSTLSSKNASNYNIRLFTDEGFYATMREKVGEKIPEGAVKEYEGQYDVYENRLLFVTMDGDERMLGDYQGLPVAENTEGWPQFYADSDIVGMAEAPDGGLTVVENQSVSYFEGTQEQLEREVNWDLWKYESHYTIRTLDENGKELSAAPIQMDMQDSYVNFYNTVLDAEGNLLATSGQSLIAVAPDGTIAYQIESPDWLDNMVQLRGGALGVLGYGEKGMKLNLVDLEAKAFGESYDLGYDAYNLFPGGGDFDYYYRSGTNLYGGTLDGSEPVKLLNLLDCDVNGDSLNGLRVKPDGSVVGVSNTYEPNGEEGTWTTELVTIHQVPASTLPQKSVLTLAILGREYDWDLSNTVVKFNRQSQTTRIQVKDYSEYNTESDGRAGRTKLTTEIMSGQLPDLMNLGGLPYSQLAAKGLLEDLYPYLDADKELSREDIFPNVLRAMEVGGKLYEACPVYSIMTLIGASSVVGDTPGWTYDQFNQALAGMPAGCTPLEEQVTRDQILERLVFLEMDNLVDWSTGKCSFDSQTMIDILNFAKQFPASFDWESYDYSEENSTERRLAEGRQMLMSANIYNIDTLKYNDLSFGGASTYIGYPVSSGVGSMISLGSGVGKTYAMSATCADKDGAWEFLRMYFTEKLQETQFGLPTNVHVYERQLKKAMTPEYQKDADGNFVLNEDGEKIQVSQGTIGRADGSVMNIYAMTQDQADRLMEVIENTDRAMDENDAVFGIVSEQAQAFFAGQKTAEEVVRLIQSKANIYVNEQL